MKFTCKYGNLKYDFQKLNQFLNNTRRSDSFNFAHIVLYSLLFFSSVSFGQGNLVPNPSFEDTLACPSTAGYINYAPPWYDATGASADYFNSCATFTVSVPSNYVGYQFAHKGVAYTGIQLYNNLNLREYIQCPLLAKLQAAQTYAVELYVSLSDTVSIAANNLGIFFSDTALTGSPGQVLNITPQILNPSSNPLTSKTNWIKIFGTFIASGGENYITIGNFNFDASTDTTHVAGGIDSSAYYYIDDVSVICTDCPPAVTEEFMIPTLLTSDDLFDIKGLPVGSSLRLFNSLGQLVYYNPSYDNKLDVGGFSSGFYYFYIALANGEVYKGKICIVSRGM